MSGRPVPSLISPYRLTRIKTAGPRLDIPWQKRHSHLSESIRALFGGPSAPKHIEEDAYFRDFSTKPRVRRRSIVASVIWHAVALVLLIQFGAVLLTGRSTPTVSNFDLSWSGPINDLPLIAPAAPVKRLSAHGNPKQPLPQRGADAFHPRQTLISAPKTPTHPRQTLIRPDAPPAPPKILPAMPNIVMVDRTPQRPVRNIATDKLLKQPKQPTQTAALASPDLPNQEKNLADINFASDPAADLKRPALTLSSGHGTVAAPRSSSASASSSEPPPTIGGGTNNQTLIALSATPGPAAPAAPIPAGNVAANVSISPEGTKPGSPAGSDKGASGNGGTGGNSSSAGGNAGGGGHGAVIPGISVTGGDPTHSPGISGVGNSSSLRNAPAGVRVTPGTVTKHDTPPPTSASVPFAERVKPGSPPEHVFGDRTIYTLNVNMPNLSSVSGSWILKFAELDENPDSAPHQFGVPKADPRGPLSGPQVLHQVDPRYPPDQVKAHIEGEVILYAIIREDGTVDSVQVARGLDPVLDKNAMEALSQWRFTPAHRNAIPVALEAIVHIPFRSTKRDY